MSIIKAYPRVLHLFFNAVIVGLLGYICYEKYTDQDKAVQQSFQQAFQQAVPEIRHYNHFLKDELLENAEKFKNPLNERAKQMALDITAQADTLLQLIDSLQRQPNPALLYLVQGKLPNFRSMAWKKLDYDPSLAPKMNAFFIPDNWLAKVDRTLLATVLEQSKADVVQIEHLSLNYLCHRYIGIYCGFDVFRPFLSYLPLNPNVGDTILATVVLSTFSSPVGKTLMRFEGRELPIRDGVAKFKVRHKTPGIYPLHFSLSQSDWRTDSMSTVEKTYYLRVD